MVKFSFMKKIHLRPKLRIVLLVVFVLGLLSTSLAGWQSAFASVLTKSSVVEYSMVTGASGAGNMAISFYGATASATSVNVNFSPNSSGLINSGGATVNTGSLNVTGTGCTAFFPTATGVTASVPSWTSPTLTFTTTSLSATTQYCAIISATGGFIATNPSVAGVYSVQITAGSNSQIDGVDVISSDTYSVTGTIAPTFTMSFPGSDSFTGNLSSTAVTSTTGVTVTINTNAISGWFLWAADSQQGLYSTQQTKLIPSVAAGSNANMTSLVGSEKYALGVYSATSGAATTAYADASNTTGGGLTSVATGFNEIASGTVPYANDYVVVKELADISSTTPPATDYGDIVTIVGAGSF
jgi:hypothetical protein